MKKLTFAFILLFTYSIAYGDDLTEYGELVSVELIANGSDLASLINGRVTLRTNDMDTLYNFGGTSCGSRGISGEMISALQNAALAPYMRVRFRTQPGRNVPEACVVGVELINEKFLTQ